MRVQSSIWDHDRDGHAYFTILDNNQNSGTVLCACLFAVFIKHIKFLLSNILKHFSTEKSSVFIFNSYGLPTERARIQLVLEVLGWSIQSFFEATRFLDILNLPQPWGIRSFAVLRRSSPYDLYIWVIERKDSITCSVTEYTSEFGIRSF